MKTFKQFMKESEEKRNAEDDSDYQVGHAVFGKHSKNPDKKDDDDDKKDDDDKEDKNKKSDDDDNDGDDDESGTDDVNEEVSGGLFSGAGVEGKHEELTKHYSGFTPDHKKAIKDYTRSSFNLNSSLLSEHKGFDHKGNPHDPEDHKRYMPQVKKLDSAMKKHKTPSDMHVYTGLGYSPAQYKPEGHNGTDPIKVHHPAFTSTSLSLSNAKVFAEPAEHHENDAMRDHNHIMKIHVPKGHHGAYVDHVSAQGDEREFMLPRNTKLKVHPVPEHHVDGGVKYAIWHAHIDK